ncbi:MAG TPA: hypothetical protein VF260_12730, partial [Bacilli bacterium]
MSKTKRKNKFFISVLALLLVLSYFVSAPPINAAEPETDPFSGSPDEWSAINHDSAVSANLLTYLKSVQKDNKLYINIRGNNLTDSGIFFIDSDNNTSTGCNISIWADSGGIDDKVENGTLYHCNSGAWAESGAVTVRKTDQVIEAVVD